MALLRYTLVGDGPGDARLTHVIDWVLRTDPKRRVRKVKAQVAELRWLREPPAGLKERIEAGFQQFPCDLLFVHRDAERESVEKRQEEIAEATAEAGLPPYVPVVPVRMTEAWLLIDETAIRKAADNPNGTTPVDLPPLKKLEALPDPKRVLEDGLFTASELSGRHRKRFKRRLSAAMMRVAALIDDYSPLRELVAFRTFEDEMNRALDQLLSTR